MISPVLICVGLFVVLIVGFRAFHVGVDTLGYVDVFEEIKTGNESVFTERRVAWLYKLINHIAIFFGGSATVVFVTVAAIAVLLIFSAIKKYSVDPALSLAIFFSYSFFFYMHNGLRESLAISVVFFGFRYLLDRNYLAVFFVFFVAFHFHNGSLFMAAMYLIAHRKLDYRFYLFIWLGSIVVALQLYSVSFLLKYFYLFTPDVYLHYLDSDLISERNSRNTVALGFLLRQFFFLLCFFAYINADENERKNNMLFSLSMTGIILFNFSYQLGYVMRLTNYGAAFPMLAIPAALHILVGTRLRFLVKTLLLLVLSQWFIIAAVGGEHGAAGENYQNLLFSN